MYIGEPQFQIMKEKWETFFVENNLLGKCVHYFDRVSSVDAGDNTMYDGQWIWVSSKGQVSKYKMYKKPLTPKLQYKYFNGKRLKPKIKQALI